MSDPVVSADGDIPVFDARLARMQQESQDVFAQPTRQAYSMHQAAARTAALENARSAAARVEVVRPQTSPVFTHRRQESNTRRASATSPTIASPPTNVYMQLAGPYQPMTYVRSTPQNHRALALLASPEAVGILPVHPSFDRPGGLDAEAPFLPAPQIFPKTGRRGRVARAQHNDEDDAELPPASSVASPSAALHIQSPVRFDRCTKSIPD